MTQPERVVGTSSAAMEDYLEQILQLIDEKGYARVVDISSKLGIAQASVSNMIQRLDAEGLVVYEKYRGVVLTPHGEKIARAIIKRHESLTEFLVLFGIDAETIYEDVEGMEHHVSSPTLDVIRALTEELQKDPALVRRIRKKIKK